MKTVVVFSGGLSAAWAMLGDFGDASVAATICLAICVGRYGRKWRIAFARDCGCEHCQLFLEKWTRQTSPTMSQLNRPFTRIEQR